MSDKPFNFKRLRRRLDDADTASSLYQLIVNLPFNESSSQINFMFLGIIVLLLVNSETQTIDRVALSDTDLAKRTTDVSVVPFSEIKLKINEPNNIICSAVSSQSMQDTTDWRFLFSPVLKPNEARINQANAGIAYSAVYPFKALNGGALIYSYFQYKELVGQKQRNFMENYTAIVNDRLNTFDNI